MPAHKDIYKRQHKNRRISLHNESNLNSLPSMLFGLTAKRNEFQKYFLRPRKISILWMYDWQQKCRQLNSTWHNGSLLSFWWQADLNSRLPEAFPPVYHSFIRRSAENNGIMVIILIQHTTYTSHNHWYKHPLSILGETGLFVLLSICHSCSKMIKFALG